MTTGCTLASDEPELLTYLTPTIAINIWSTLLPEFDDVDGDDEMRDKVSSRNCNTK